VMPSAWSWFVLVKFFHILVEDKTV
jgi:hypothetical protein